jgi:hypothetical protein
MDCAETMMVTKLIIWLAMAYMKEKILSLILTKAQHAPKFLDMIRISIHVTLEVLYVQHFPFI